MTKYSFALVALFTLFLASFSAHATTIDVTSTEEDGPNTNSAFFPCGTVGSYTGDGLANGNCSLREAFAAIRCEIAVDACPAGGAGWNTVVLQANTTYTFTSPIDDDAFSGDNSAGPNVFSLISSAITIEGNGSTITRDPDTQRSRFFEVGGFLTLHDLTFENGDSCVINEQLVTECRPGGAIRIDNGIVTIDGVSFINNTSLDLDNNKGDSGGAIAVTTDLDDAAPLAPLSILTINNSLFDGNSGSGGGAIVSMFSKIEVTASIFHANTAGIEPTGGGAIGLMGGELSITKSSFSDNQAPVYGGALALTTLSSITDYSLLSGGLTAVAPAYGFGNTFSVTRSTFSNNSSGLGGAIFIGSGYPGMEAAGPKIALPKLTISGAPVDLALNGDTFSENNATIEGGAIYETEAVTSFENTILYGNTDDAVSNTRNNCSGEMISLGYNQVQDDLPNGDCPFTLTTGDAQGDPGLGAYSDSLNGYPLLCSDASPTVDGGNTNSATPEDQNYTGWTGSPDKGALESSCVKATTTTPTTATCGDGVVDTGETCDDGNTTAGDGCSATCQTETASAAVDPCDPNGPRATSLECLSVKGGGISCSISEMAGGPFTASSLLTLLILLSPLGVVRAFKRSSLRP